MCALTEITAALGECYDCTSMLNKDSLSYAAPNSSVYIFLAYVFRYAC